MSVVVLRARRARCGVDMPLLVVRYINVGRVRRARAYEVVASMSGGRYSAAYVASERTSGATLLR